MRARLITLILVVLLALPALTIVSSAGAQGANTPYWPTESWRTSTPEEQGIDSAQLLAALDFIDANAIPLDSITIIRHGYVVLDA
jgi:hypothetical protein